MASVIVINRIEADAEDCIGILPGLGHRGEKDLIRFQKRKTSCGIHQMLVKLSELVRLQHAGQGGSFRYDLLPAGFQTQSRAVCVKPQDNRLLDIILTVGILPIEEVVHHIV